MARRGRGRSAAKWAIIGSAVGGAAALITLLPVIKKRAMRVTTILKKDHKMVSGMIMTLQAMPRIAAAPRKALFEQIRNNVIVHAQAEEEVLYPAMRTLMATDGPSMVDESYREHQQIKDLLNDLATMDPSSDPFDTKFADFKSKIDHHVEEEENELFPTLLQRASTERQEELGRRIHNRKLDLKARIAA